MKRKILMQAQPLVKHNATLENAKKAQTSAGVVIKTRRYIKGGEYTGVDDGARTHDHRNHNPGLYQLSYAHHISVSGVLGADGGIRKNQPKQPPTPSN